jgi:RNA polymerase sigma factor (sigma-70 family)
MLFDNKRFAAISVDEQRRLIAIIQEDGPGARSAKSDLVTGTLGLVYSSLNNRFKINQRHPMHDDLVQEGCIGILEAAKRFDLSRNLRFVTFANIYIFKCIRDCLVSTGHPVRIPLGAFHNRKTSPGVSQALDTIINASCFDVYSRDKNLQFTRNHVEEIQDTEESLFHGSLLKKSLDAMPDAWRIAVQLRYWEGCEFSEIARRMGFTKQRAEQVVKRGVRELQLAFNLSGVA